MNENHRGEELCSACGFATGHAGYGEGSIGYVDGTIGPLCDKCNERLRVEVEADSDEIERLRASVNEEERQLCYLSCWVQERFGVNTNVAISDLDLPPAKTLARVIVHTVDAEIEKLRAFIRADYDCYETYHPYAHKLREQYPWLAAAEAAGGDDE